MHSDMTTYEYKEKFIRYLMDKNMSKATIKSYSNIVSKFFDFAKVNPKNVRSEMISEYIRSLNAPRTKNQTIGCLKTFFKEVCGMPKVVSVPYANVPRSLPKIISKQQFNEGLSRCQNPKHRLIFRLMFNHGLRRGEVIAFRIGWFRSEVLEGKKQFYAHVTGKGSKDRIIWMRDETMSDLVLYAEVYDIDLHDKSRLLFGDKNGKPYSAGSIQNLTMRYFGCSPHTLRRGGATTLFNNRVGDLNVQEFLGHSSLMTCSIYKHSSLASKVGIAA